MVSAERPPSWMSMPHASCKMDVQRGWWEVRTIGWDDAHGSRLDGSQSDWLAINPQCKRNAVSLAINIM